MKEMTVALITSDTKSKVQGKAIVLPNGIETHINCTQDCSENWVTLEEELESYNLQYPESTITWTNIEWCEPVEQIN